MGNKGDWKEVLKITGAYVALCIGSGFATGQEIMQFYTLHGTKSLICGLSTLILMGICGALVLRSGRKQRENNVGDVYAVFCGPYLGRFFRGFMPIFMFLTFSIMLAGAGAAIEQYFGINASIGRFVFASVVLASLFMGFERLVQILGSFGNIIAILAVSIGLVSIFQNIDGLANADQVASALNNTKAVPYWWMSGIVYGGLCMLIGTPFLFQIGRKSEREIACRLGGLFGASVLMMAAMVLNLAMLGDLKMVSTQQIPTLYLASQISPIASTLFIGMLIVGIYSASMPLLWMTTTAISKEGTKGFKWAAIVLVGVAYFAGSVPFGKLVGWVYPPAGYVGVILSVGIIIRGLSEYFRNERKKKSLKGKLRRSA
jgi:uncharacterized membrane protein YkvI